MEIRKFSHGPDIGLMVLNFSWRTLLHHTNLHAKNERNLPSSFEDRSPPSNCLATMTEERDSCLDDVVHDVTRAHDVARDVTDVKQIRVEVLGMPNFEFLKSDHY